MSRPRAFAVIPARAGSRRVIGKNFRPIGETNLTEIAVRLCCEAGFFDNILLSTDCEAGEKLAGKWEITCHKRSSHAASDSASASDVLRDVQSSLIGAGIRENDYLFYLQPTSPLRTISMLKDSWARLLQYSHQGLVSVTEIDRKFRKALVVDGDTVKPHGQDEALTSNQQNLSPLYLANGNLFAFRWGLYIEIGQFPLEGLHFVLEPDEFALDIDSESDFESYLARKK